MRSSNYEQQLFEHKNQAYGAYRLRQLAPRAQLVGFGIALVLWVGLMGIPLWTELLKKKPEVASTEKLRIKANKRITYAQLSAPPPIEMEVPPTNPEATAAPRRAQRRFVQPTVRPDEEVPDAPPLPTREDLRRIDPGREDVEGVEGATYVGPPIDENVVLEAPPLEAPETVEEEEPIAPPPPPPPPPKEEEEVYVIVEKMPSFPGGQEAFFAYLAAEIQYPNIAKDSNIEGTVVVQFIVMPDGQCVDFKVLRPVAGGCTEEALRVLGNMPLWEPGVQGKYNVKVKVTVPIRFKLLAPK